MTVLRERNCVAKGLAAKEDEEQETDEDADARTDTLTVDRWRSRTDI